MVRRERNKGVSLIELIVAVAIGILLVGLSAREFRIYKSKALRAAGEITARSILLWCSETHNLGTFSFATLNDFSTETSCDNTNPIENPGGFRLNNCLEQRYVFFIHCSFGLGHVYAFEGRGVGGGPRINGHCGNDPGDSFGIAGVGKIDLSMGFNCSCEGRMGILTKLRDEVGKLSQHSHLEANGDGVS